MKYFNLLLWTLLLMAVSCVLPADKASAKICGCFVMGSWHCATSMNYCTPNCGANIEMFPTRAACTARGVAAAQLGKAKTTAPKVIQTPAAKKQAVKVAQKQAPTKPNSPKVTSIEKEMARLEPEQQPAPPPETSIAKQDRNVDPQAQQPVATANLSLETPAPSSKAPALSVPVDKATLGRRVALVIGNSAYAAVPALKNPPMDAKAIADTLTSLGFEKVTLKLDLDRQGIWAALADFADEASRADWAVVYYAGHGIELDGQNYIIPVDARLESDRKVLFETVPLDHVVEATAGARKFRLVILDACRNNPFLSSMTRVASSRSIGRGLSRVEPQGGVLVAYAAKAGEIASDGETGNSPFVTALIEQFKQPGVEVGFLFRRVRDSVLDMTNGTQEPYTYGSLPGREELYFKPPVN